MKIKYVEIKTINNGYILSIIPCGFNDNKTLFLEENDIAPIKQAIETLFPWNSIDKLIMFETNGLTVKNNNNIYGLKYDNVQGIALYNSLINFYKNGHNI
jgi:hypothetical protein